MIKAGNNKGRRKEMSCRKTCLHVFADFYCSHFYPFTLNATNIAFLTHDCWQGEQHDNKGDSLTHSLYRITHNPTISASVSTQKTQSEQQHKRNSNFLCHKKSHNNFPFLQPKLEFPLRISYKNVIILMRNKK